MRLFVFFVLGGRKMDSNVGIDYRSRIEELAKQVREINATNWDDDAPSSIVILPDGFSLGGSVYGFDESGLRAAETQAAEVRESIRRRVEKLARNVSETCFSNDDAPAIIIPDGCDYFLIGKEKYNYDAEGMVAASKHAEVVTTFMCAHLEAIRGFEALRLSAAQAGMLIRIEGCNAIFYVPGVTGNLDRYPYASETKMCELRRFPVTKCSLKVAKIFVDNSMV